MQRFLRVAVLLLAACARRETETALPLQVAPAVYTSDGFEARVTDGKSGAPIEGAVVLAIWRNISADFETWKNIFVAEETVTDAQGRFRIARWGPRPPSPGTYLDRRDPELWVLKRGYRLGYFDDEGARQPLVPRFDDDRSPVEFVKLPPARLPNLEAGELARAPHATSIWNGKTLTLAPIASDEENARSLAAANPLDPFLPSPPNSFPRFFAEWQAARQTLPPALRAKVEKPMSLLDYVTPAKLR